MLTLKNKSTEWKLDKLLRQIKTLRLIEHLCPEVLIGGSLGLRLGGLLEREADDLDLIVSAGSFKLLERFFKQEQRSEYTGPGHFSFSVNGVDVCAFSVEVSQYGDHEGRTIDQGAFKGFTLQKPKHAIKAKREWVTKLGKNHPSAKKHKADLAVINEAL